MGAIDRHLPGGGLAAGALHEIADSPDLADGASATVFLAGILARIEGSVFWCLRWRDLFAPALHLAGLHPDRVIYVEARKAVRASFGASDGSSEGRLTSNVTALELVTGLQFSPSSDAGFRTQAEPRGAGTLTRRLSWSSNSSLSPIRPRQCVSPERSCGKACWKNSSPVKYWK